MTEHVRTVHEGKKRIYTEVNGQVNIKLCTLRTSLFLISQNSSVADPNPHGAGFFA